jgi:hypothetical protein
VTQGRAQPPQCARSVAVSTQAPPQRVGVAPPQPLPHVAAPPDELQTGVGSAHRVAQSPHVSTLTRLASQPLVALPSQLA